MDANLRHEDNGLENIKKSFKQVRKSRAGLWGIETYRTSIKRMSQNDLASTLKVVPAGLNLIKSIEDMGKKASFTIHPDADYTSKLSSIFNSPDRKKNLSAVGEA